MKFNWYGQLSLKFKIAAKPISLITIVVAPRPVATQTGLTGQTIFTHFFLKVRYASQLFTQRTASNTALIGVARSVTV
ncbi:hypothetical protein BSQ39_05580 [Loigolactobacillus backii]|uniref:hypothetical protein n=1 Tax=Loigolactobacillus backii TaxID=375175 RepID=UPI000C1CB234|nr:hypothetical protein [Loigolactobacillus backii]PIO83081.1 hypothetical protein BSQ39_05580 [Loigolactobacillus backii]